MAGLALAVAGQNLTVLLIGILLFAGTTVFAFVTLPVGGSIAFLFRFIMVLSFVALVSAMDLFGTEIAGNFIT